MKKTEALRISRKAHTGIYNRGQYGYVFYSPAYDHKPNGAQTEVHGNDYWMARAKRTRCIVECALAQMGYKWDDYSFETEAAISDGYTTQMDMMNFCLRRLGKQ